MLSFPNNKEVVTAENGFVDTKALDIRRFFMRGENFLRLHGNTITSLEGNTQEVTAEKVVLFDDYGTLIGYCPSVSAFDKYEIESEIEGAEGKAVKKDPTIYKSKLMTEDFEAKIWDGSFVPGKAGDYLVCNPEKDDFRVVNAAVFKDSYAVV